MTHPPYTVKLCAEQDCDWVGRDGAEFDHYDEKHPEKVQHLNDVVSMVPFCSWNEEPVTV